MYQGLACRTSVFQASGGKHEASATRDGRPIPSRETRGPSSPRAASARLKNAEIKNNACSSG